MNIQSRTICASLILSMIISGTEKDLIIGSGKLKEQLVKKRKLVL